LQIFFFYNRVDCNVDSYRSGLTVFWVVYAASITSTTDTVSSWDSITSTTKPIFNAYSESSLSITWNMNVTFPSESVDTTNSFDGTTFTAPVTWYYYFSTSISYQWWDWSDDTTYISFLKNTSTHHWRVVYNIKANSKAWIEDVVSTNAIIQLNQWDTVKVFQDNHQNTITTFEYRSFQGYLIN